MSYESEYCEMKANGYAVATEFGTDPAKVWYCTRCSRTLHSGGWLDYSGTPHDGCPAGGHWFQHELAKCHCCQAVLKSRDSGSYCNRCRALGVV